MTCLCRQCLDYSEDVWPCNTVQIQLHLIALQKNLKMKTPLKNFFCHCGGMCQIVIEIKDIITLIIQKPYLLINDDLKKMLPIIY